MIRNFRIKILLIVFITCLLLLTVVLVFVFAATREELLSNAYNSMLWALDDIDNGIYYGIPKGAPRTMAIIFVNPDGTLDKENTVVDEMMQFAPEMGSYEDITKMLLQYDGSPSMLSVADATYLYSYRTFEDGKTVFILVSVTRNMRVLRTYIKNALLASASALVVMVLLSLVFANWVIQPIAWAKKTQQDFFTAVSHDLRTPLTVILANTGLLEELDGVDPLLIQCRENIRAESEQMKKMIARMLEHLSFENIVANRKVLKKDEINLEQILLKSINSFKSLFHNHGLEVQHDLVENLWIRGNQSDIERLINILLENALKYSDKESSVRICLKTENSKTLQLDVHSVSEPMDKQTMTKIFMPFYRLDMSRSDSDSYGLGLSSAKSIVEIHGGRIWGTTGEHENVFHVSLPMIEPPASFPQAGYE